MDDTILLKLYESIKNGERAALAVITEEVGSSPRKSGSIMAVWADRKIMGSVGGGKIEYTIITQALECLEKKEDYKFEYKLTEKELGMQCGGVVKGYIKVFYPRNRLFIAGAGHIGEKLNKLAKTLNFHTIIIDEREEYANIERFADADEVIVSNIGNYLNNFVFTSRDYVVIVTNGHATDKAALKAVIGKNANYIGMIGSVKKIKSIMRELIDEGVLESELKKVYAPIGLNLSSELPEEIALGILSEILLIKNKGSLNHYKDLKNVWD